MQVLAGVIQLVECQLPKLDVVGSSPIARSEIEGPSVTGPRGLRRRGDEGALAARPWHPQNRSMRPLVLLLGTVVAAVTTRDVRTLSIQTDAPYSRVEVQGRCLPAGAVVALGAAPRSASDWQLQDVREVGTAVWVSGSRPSGCEGVTPDTTTYVVRARVYIDTVRVESESTRRARLFLVGSLR